MTTSAFIAPQQARSREALERILNATEALLNERHFDDLSIQEISQVAQISVGNFYARFRTKKALLEVLHERYERERKEVFTTVMESVAESPLKEKIESVICTVVRLFWERRGVLRSFIMIHWRQPKAMSRSTEQRLGRLYEHFRRLLLDSRREISHPAPEVAVDMVVNVTLATCRETLVLRPATLPAGRKQPDPSFARELSQMIYGYLTSSPEAMGTAAIPSQKEVQ